MIDLPTDENPVVVFHGDCLDILPQIPAGAVDAVVTDPPYGISYKSGMTGHDGGTALPGIVGDEDTWLRDQLLNWWNGPAIVFGSWKIQRPSKTKAILIWDKGSHVGMGDLSLPWKPNTEEIYVIGYGFSGHRGSSVLSYSAPVSWNSVGFGRTHPHEKPIGLIRELISKTPGAVILDPFAGSGTMGVAAILEGRKAILIEKDAGYVEVIKKRIAETLGRPTTLANGKTVGRNLFESIRQESPCVKE